MKNPLKSSLVLVAVTVLVVAMILPSASALPAPQPVAEVTILIQGAATGFWTTDGSGLLPADGPFSGGYIDVGDVTGYWILDCDGISGNECGFLAFAGPVGQVVTCDYDGGSYSGNFLSSTFELGSADCVIGWSGGALCAPGMAAWSASTSFYISLSAAVCTLAP